MSERPGPRLIATAVLGIAWAVLPAAFGFLLLANIGPASDWLREHRGAGWLVYAVVFAVTSGLGLLPTYAQAVVGGWVFGLAWGSPGALLGFAGGALLGYALTRLVGKQALRERIDRHPRAQVIRESLIDRGFWRTVGTVTLLRLPPNSPFALTNLAMAGAGVRLVPYVVGTILGMAPRTIVMVGLGATGAASGARDLQSLAKERSLFLVIGGIVLTIVVLLILGAVANAALRRAGLTGERQASTDPAPSDSGGTAGS